MGRQRKVTRTFTLARSEDERLARVAKRLDMPKSQVLGLLIRGVYTTSGDAVVIPGEPLEFVELTETVDEDGEVSYTTASENDPEA